MASMFKVAGATLNQERCELMVEAAGNRALGWSGEGFTADELAITRGWTMFMTMNQPTTMMTRMGTTSLGWVRMAATTGGAHDTNGPKNGIIWKIATRAVVSGA